MNKFVISSVAALALVAGASSANGQTVAELQALIASLQSQIAALAGTTTTTTVASSYVNPGVTLRVGSKGVAVTALQNALNNLGFNAGKADGVFGNGTAAAVRAFQASKGLGADGVAGNQTHGALTVALSGTTTVPNTNTGSTTLNGGAGTATFTNRTSGIESKAQVGRSDVKVVSYDVKATGSDINLSHLSLNLVKATGANASNRAERYIDEVVVFQDNKEVGSLSINSFDWSNDNAGRTYKGQVSLNNVVIKKDTTARFFLAVTTKPVIDTADLGATFTLAIESARYTDATGAILSPSTTSVSKTFGFEKLATASGVELRLARTSNSPTASTVTVNKTSTKEVLMNEFRLNARGTDVVISSISATIDSTISNVDDIVETLILKRGNTEIDSVDIADVISSGTMASQVVFNFDNEIEIAEGDSETFTIYAKVNKLDGVNGFTTASTLRASVATSGIDAEDQNGDRLTGNINGSASGEALTFIIEGVDVKKVSDSSAAANQDGKSVDFTLVFDVTANGKDITIDRNTVTSGTASGDVKYNVVGTGVNTVSHVVTSDAALSGNTYTVYEGQTRRFTLTVNVTTSVTGPKYISLKEVDGQVLSSVIETAPRTVNQ